MPVLKVERIIIVTANPNEHEQDAKAIAEVTSLPVASNTNALSEPGGIHDPLELSARIEGVSKAQEVVDQFNNRKLEEFPTDLELHREGQRLGLDYLRKNNPAAFANTTQATELRDTFAKIFVESYSEWLGRETGDGRIPNEATRKLHLSARKKAREDKKVAAENSQLSLDTRRLTILAAIRAYLYLSYAEPHFSDNSLLSYVPRIEEFLSEYIKTYEDDRQEEQNGGDGRSQRPGGFPR
ncbi:MAG: hypothetical protein IMW89_10015 [Ktedonobacteraceae bacterium]|nr:hypothetical protein [Ktedonobacteraceae bacterium]